METPTTDAPIINTQCPNIDQSLKLKVIIKIELKPQPKNTHALKNKSEKEPY